MDKLFIATAGSGKTTKLVQLANEKAPDSVIILTYTEENEKEIRDKFYTLFNEIPNHICIQTWFSFLMQHGVKPYQGTFNEKLYFKTITGLILCNSQSGIKYYSTNANNKKIAIKYKEETEFIQHYFTNKMQIYSDKLSKFVVKSNLASEGKLIKRISSIYKNIFIDEVQDLAGYDLEIIKSLAKSNSEIILAGDPRQVTYLTHHEQKYNKYNDGGIKLFIQEKCKYRGRLLIDIDESTLLKSHRNNASICSYSSKLYPNFPESIPCDCPQCHPSNIEHQGVFFVKKDDVYSYLRTFEVMQLRWDRKQKVDNSCSVLNFGASKGKTFDRVLIYPTKGMLSWVLDSRKKISSSARAKFYVAITRARYSVAIVYDYENGENIDGITNYYI